jgi:hypothetical protein
VTGGGQPVGKGHGGAAAVLSHTGLHCAARRALEFIRGLVKTALSRGKLTGWANAIVPAYGG